MLVIDWFHWKLMGDWSFDPEYWPDVKAMVDECTSYGIHIMASVWPFTCEDSSTVSPRVGTYLKVLKYSILAVSMLDIAVVRVSR